VGFEVVGGEIAEGGMPAFGVVIGEIVADFYTRFTQVSEAAAIEQLGFEPTPKRFGVSVIVCLVIPSSVFY
jgi:hypothetical protein